MSIRMPIAEVYRTSSVDDALAFLAEHPGARPLAGGTDLLVELRTRWGGPLVGKPGGAQGADGGGGADLSPASLLDISGLPELRDIRADGRKLVIGACARVAEVASSPQVAAAAPTLAQAAGSVGSVQIRNRATLGGNIMNASPAADSLPALAVHEALCACSGRSGAGRGGSVWGETFDRPYCTCARPDELLVAVELEGGSGWRQSYMRLGRRQAADHRPPDSGGAHEVRGQHGGGREDLGGCRLSEPGRADRAGGARPSRGAVQLARPRARQAKRQPRR